MRNVYLGQEGERCLLRILDPDLERTVLFCHGFPGTNRLPYLGSALRREGVTLANLEYRGDRLAEGKFSFLACQQDILTAARYLRDLEKSVLILGFSWGGLAALRAFLESPQDVDRLVLLNGVIDPYVLRDPAIAPELWTGAKEILRLQDSYAREIATLSASPQPVDVLRTTTRPITIVQSTNDEAVPPALAYHVARRNPTITLYKIPGAKHDLRGDEPELLRALR